MTGNQNEEPPVLPPSVTEISSTSNAYVKHCVRLRSSSRYRQEAGRCLLVGRDLLEEAAGEIMAGGGLDHAHEYMMVRRVAASPFPLHKLPPGAPHQGTRASWTCGSCSYQEQPPLPAHCPSWGWIRCGRCSLAGSLTVPRHQCLRHDPRPLPISAEAAAVHQPHQDGRAAALRGTWRQCRVCGRRPR